jgi:hypothetical protein
MCVTKKSLQQAAARPRRAAIRACVVVALGGALCGCGGKNDASTANPKAFMPPPPGAEQQVQSIPNPAVRAQVQADIARMRTAASGSYHGPPTPNP